MLKRTRSFNNFVEKGKQRLLLLCRDELLPINHIFYHLKGLF